MTPLIKKTLLVSLLAIGGLIALVFAFGSADPLERSIAKKAPLPRFESVGSLAGYGSITKSNTTAGLAEKIAAEIIAENPTGPQATEGGERIAALNPEELVQRALSETFSDLDVDDLRPTIKTNDLIIIQSSEARFAQAYFNSVNDIFKRSFPETLVINWDHPEQTDTRAFVTAFGKTADDLYKVAVPQPLASLHRELLSLVIAQRNVFALLQDYQNDPAQAALAIEAGDRFGLEIETVFNAMDSYIVKNHIVLTG